MTRDEWDDTTSEPEPPEQEIDPIESDLHDLGSVLASLADLVKDCHDPAKLFDVYCELGKIAKATMELQDKVGAVGNFIIATRTEQ